MTTIYDALLEAITEADDSEAIAAIGRFVARFGSLRTIGVERDGTSVLYWMAFADRPAVARALIQAGITLDAEADAVVDPMERDTALHAAVDRDSAELLQLLLEAGGHRLVNTFDFVERTPLHIAAARGSIQLATMLLGAGADPNAQDESRIGNPPLQGVGLNLQMARLLLDAGADPTRPGWMQVTPLDEAASAGADGTELLELYRQHLGWSPGQLAAFLSRGSSRASPPSHG